MAYGEYGRWCQESHLEHFGIPGQKWGVRRFQNEDGTLTEAGKARYYDNLTDRQKKTYDKMTPKIQQKIEQKMGEGKSFSRAQQEVTQAERRKANIKASVAFTAAYGAYLMWAFPQLRRAVKGGMLQAVSKIVNTKAVGGTLLKAKKMIDRMKMRKAGAVIVKAKDAWISGDLLGA